MVSGKWAGPFFRWKCWKAISPLLLTPTHKTARRTLQKLKVVLWSKQQQQQQKRVCSKGVPRVQPGVMYRFHRLLSSLELWIGSKMCRWPHLRCADATRTWWTGDDLGDQRHEVRLGKMQERRVFKDESNCVQTRWRIRLLWGLLSIIQQTQSHGLTRWSLISQGKHRAGTSWSVN